MADDTTGEVNNLHLDEVTGEKVRSVVPASGNYAIANLTIARVSSRNASSNEKPRRRRKPKPRRHHRKSQSIRQPKRRRVI